MVVFRSKLLKILSDLLKMIVAAKYLRSLNERVQNSELEEAPVDAAASMAGSANPPGTPEGGGGALMAFSTRWRGRPRTLTWP